MSRWMIEPYRPGYSKIICPHCHKKSYTRYIDKDQYENKRMIVYFGDEYGICDHKDNCGYNNYPSAKCKSKDKPIAAPEEKEPVYYSLDLVAKYEANPLYNNLAQFLISTKKFDGLRLLEIFRKYHVGSCADKRVVFWQIDHENKVHRGKIMGYNEDGHRTKYINNKGEEAADVSSMRVMLKRSLDIEPKMCYFGQHLYQSDKPIALVESEKTALIASYVLPEYVWMATSSIANFRSYNLGFAKKNLMVVFPDADGYTQWQDQANKIKELGFNIQVNNFIERYGKNKEDIADILLRIM